MPSPGRGPPLACLEGVDGVSRADDDEAPAHVQHLDVGAVQLGQHLGRHDLRGRADLELAVDEIEHPVDQRQDRIDLVGDEQHRGVVLAAAPIDQFRGLAVLVREVEAEQRLVTQQHLGVCRRVPARSAAAAARRRTSTRRGRRRRDCASHLLDGPSLTTARRVARIKRTGPVPQRCPSTPSPTRSRPRSGRSVVDGLLLRYVSDVPVARAPGARRRSRSPRWAAAVRAAP